MITWTVGLTARPGREDGFIALANELTETSNRLDEGCVVYICLQNLADPRNFLWYEQWATMPLLERHVARIGPLLRGSRDDPESPRLSAVIERREQLGYDVLQDADPEPRDWASAGITSWVEVRAKPGREEAFRELATELSRSGQAREGCVSHIAHQREDDPRLFNWLEQWRDKDALAARMEALIADFGAPRGGEGLDALPAGFADEIETIAVKRCRVVAT